jgi:hypothetical protein
VVRPQKAAAAASLAGQEVHAPNTQAQLTHVLEDEYYLEGVWAGQGRDSKNTHIFKTTDVSAYMS